VTATVIVADKVTKVFEGGRRDQVVALKDLDLEVAEGEFVCLVGGSGCGKTTFLNLVAGFLAPTDGVIYLRGRPIAGIEPRAGMIFQSYALLPWKTVAGNVEFGPKMKRLPRAERRAIAERFIRMVGLTGFEHFYPGQLSGGMQQRVTLARLLAADREVFLMDEPFAALDAMTRQVMQEELIRIHEQSGKTTVFVTHNIDEALILADRIVVMSSRPGRVKTSIRNDLPRPRQVDVQLSPRYLELKTQIWGHVEEEVRRQIEATSGSARGE